MRDSRALIAGGATLVVLLALALALGVAKPSSLLLAAALTLVAALFLFVRPASAGRAAFSLFVWALALRIGVLLALSLVPGYDRLGALGPDGRGFFEGSTRLASAGFALGQSPVAAFGTYDVAHYYLFAGAIEIFGADLFGLQLLNSGLTALVAPIAFLWARVLAPRYATAIGVLVAVHPSLIAMSVLDLVRDPSIVLATAAAMWAVTELLRTTRALPATAWALLASAGLIYLRLDRFYVAAYLEAAVLVAAAVAFARAARVPRAMLAALPLVVVVAELVPIAIGWPASPAQVTGNIALVRQSAVMSDPAPSLIDRIFGPDAPRIVLSAGRRIADSARRLLGPFVWILPDRWDLNEIVRRDYVLYPGTLLWYALIPLIVAGVFAVLRRSLRRGLSGPEVALLAFALFAVVYFAQYLTVNLSYRQRDAVFPVLLMFVPLGRALWSHFANARILYGGYWAALALLAASHLAARALLAR